MKLKTLILSLFTAFSLFSGSLAGQNTDKTSKEELAKWIINIVLEKGRDNERMKKEYIIYDKTVIKYNLGENPPQEKERLVYEIYGQNGRSMERLKEKDGKPVKNSQPEASKLNFNELIVERYDLNLEREIISDGRGYYVISFKPKNEQLPFNDRLDEGINRTAGYLYVDMEKFYLKRLEGKLTNSFSKAMNIFEMKEFSIEYEQEEFESVVVPSKMVLNYKYRVFWGDTHEELRYLYSNRQRK